MPYKKIEGLENIDKVIDINHRPSEEHHEAIPQLIQAFFRKYGIFRENF